MSNPNPYNSPYGNTPQQDYGTQPQPNVVVVVTLRRGVDNE